MRARALGAGGALATGKFDGVHDFVAAGSWGAGGRAGRQAGEVGATEATAPATAAARWGGGGGGIMVCAGLQVLVSPAGSLGSVALNLTGPGESVPRINAACL